MISKAVSSSAFVVKREKDRRITLSATAGGSFIDIRALLRLPRAQAEPVPTKIPLSESARASASPGAERQDAEIIGASWAGITVHPASEKRFAAKQVKPGSTGDQS